MKKYLFVIAILIATPLVGFAAFNSVSLTDTAIISVGGVSLTIVSGSASVVESITVSSASFSVVLQNSSDITVKSTNRYTLNYSASPSTGNYSAIKECTSSYSSLQLASGDTSTITITVTPDTGTTCTGGGGSTPVGGGGGGGGGGTYTYTPPAATTPTTLSVTDLEQQVAQLQAQAAALAGLSFTRDLKMGATGNDVRELQKFLNNAGFRVAESGSGSPGNETSYFGRATQSALSRYQKSVGLPATGFFGPMSRSKIGAVGVPAVTPSPLLPTPGTTFTRPLGFGSQGADVSALQSFLSSLSDVYPEKTVSGYYGKLTERAVQKFQEQNGIAQLGDPGYGTVGPKTRAKLKQLLGSN